MKRLQPFVGIAIILLLSFWTIMPLLSSGFFPMHDNTQVGRVYEMGKALKDGMFPVRWVADLGYGYGYPIFNFYAPLAYYIGGLFVVLGIDALLATKVMMIVGIVLSGCSMYLLARLFFGERGGIFAAVFYMYAPYHALDIYVRGDVAEVYAYAFLPLVVLGIWKTYQTLRWQYAILGALAYAFLITSHNLTALMATPFLFLFLGLLLFLQYKRYGTRNILPLSSVLFLGILFSSFYWLPVFFEMQYTNVLSQIGGSADFRNHFVCISQLWNSPWGYGGSVPGCIDGMSFKLGKLHVFFSLLSFIASGIVFRLQNRKHPLFPYIAVWLSGAGLLVSLFLTLSISKSLWESLSIMAFFQYPWRFLALASFFASFVAGFSFFLVDVLISRNKYDAVRSAFLLSSCVFLIIFLNNRLFLPQDTFQTKAEDFTNRNYLIWNTSKISDEYMPKGFPIPTSIGTLIDKEFAIIGDTGEVSLLESKTQYLSGVVTSSTDAKVKVRLAYFPSWQLYRDNDHIQPKIQQGIYVIDVPKGSHKIEARFENTLVQLAGNSITIISIFATIAGIIYRKRKKTYERQST